MKKSNIFLLLLCIWSILLCSCSSTDTLTVTAIDVGKGDCILITTQNTAVLVDTGYADTADTVLETLDKKQIDSLDYLIITHFDRDHVGGAADILEQIPADEIITPDYKENSDEYNAFKKKAKTMPWTKLTSRRDILLDTAALQITPPEKEKYGQDNDYSLVLRLSHGQNTFLFAGDAQEERIEELLAEGNLSASCLKVPHHGRPENNSEAFFAAVRPQIAIITCDEGSPAPEEVAETTSLLEALGCRVYTTQSGTITAQSDGKTLDVKS